MSSKHKVAKKAFTIKTDPRLINDFKQFTKKVGITPTAAIKMFMKSCIDEQRIPLKPKIKKWHL